MDRVFAEPLFFRGEEDEKLGLYLASRMLFAFLFTFIYAKGYENRGESEGLRFGLLIWLFYTIPMTVGVWAFIKIPDYLAVSWIGIGLVENVVGGLILGTSYRAKSP